MSVIKTWWEQWKLQVNMVMDTVKCPHIPLRLIFQYTKSNMNVMKIVLEDEEKYNNFFQHLIKMWHNFKHLFDKKSELEEKIVKTLKQIDKSILEKWYPTDYDENIWEIQNIFEDFLSSWIKLLNKLSVWLWMILENDINTVTKMRRFLKEHSNESVNKMIENDEKMWSSLLAEMRSASEHENSNLIKYYSYKIEKIFWIEKLVITQPQFKYKDFDKKDILKYIIVSYINLFTFTEDIIAIWINQKLKEKWMWLQLMKTIDDWWNLDSVESVYTLHMIWTKNIH